MLKAIGSIDMVLQLAWRDDGDCTLLVWKALHSHTIHLTAQCVMRCLLLELCRTTKSQLSHLHTEICQWCTHGL